MRCVLLAALASCILPLSIRAQISPGNLSRAHQSLEGPTHCTQCHAPARDAMPRLCLTCHREVAWLVSQGRGLHAREARTAGKSCAACHPEHAGREFDLVAWPAGGKNRFDHRGAGWQLEGKHATVACERCHRAELRTGPAATLSPRRGSPGWMGLETSCASCHQADDPHAGALGSGCEKCHDATAWSPAPRFDHASSRYPLTGKHADVACTKCHLTVVGAAGAGGRRTPRFRPLEFKECSSCHADPHQGRLSATCSSCHVTRGFDVLDRRAFNHDLTRYPLLGKHRAVGCQACHGRDMSRPKPAYGTCATCHSDSHGGEATLAGAAVDCASCHRVEGFSPATFTVAQHQRTRFALGGKHASVRCAACHTASGPAGAPSRVIHIRVAFASCNGCHADPHGGQLAGRSCADCHADRDWGEIGYDRAEHGRQGFALDGAHAVLACARCHGASRPGLPAMPRTVPAGTAAIVFRITEVRCGACHSDPHGTGSGSGGRDTTLGCAECHTSSTFRAAAIDVAAHGRFNFALEGAHRAVPCRDCHNWIATPAATRRGAATLVGATQPATRIPLRAVRGTSCESCHDNPHGAQFASRPDRGRCDACHGAESFRVLSRFNHDRDAAFALTGAHATVPCARCHRTETVGGLARVIYRPIPHRCEDCHTGKAPAGPS